MIYICAQPDEYYFKWQLEVLVSNMNFIGISAKDIHILIGFDPRVGINNEFEGFKNCPYANFYLYPDERVSPKYASSLRPHIIRKHFMEHPYLQNETIFYHDADIIFRERVTEDLFTEEGVWYTSVQARNYLSYEYIRGFGKGLVKKMSDVVGISPLKIIENDKDCGGAQYIMKNVTIGFWEKLEVDSEKLYVLLENFTKTRVASNLAITTIQKWCSDMWALLWNAWRVGIKVKVHPELDFCWPFDDLAVWNQAKIFHNSGISAINIDHLFCKNGYKQHEPFYNNFYHIDKKKCTIKYIEWIQFVQNKKEKTDLKDVTFLIPVRVDSLDRIANLDISTRFLLKHFETNIILIEYDDIPRVNKEKIDSSIKYYFLNSEDIYFNRGRCLNFGIKTAETKLIVFWGTDYLCDPKQIINCTNLLRREEVYFSYPYDQNVLHIGKMLRNKISQTLDTSKLATSSTEFKVQTRLFGDCLFINKNEYLKCGLENLRIFDYRRQNEERNRRIKILGYEIERIKGVIYHLDHFTSNDEVIANPLAQDNDSKEILKISSFRKAKLLKYVESWHNPREIEMFSDLRKNCNKI